MLLFNLNEIICVNRNDYIVFTDTVKDIFYIFIMKFSIITVTYNCKEKIGITLDSVVRQKTDENTDFEYIIMDGQSDDGTIATAKSLSENLPGDISGKVFIYSEKDDGIYDAMNKAVKKATGDYILFLGAGDYLYTDDVLKKTVRLAGRRCNADILYGYVYTTINGKLKDEIRKFDIKYSLRILPIYHQAVFAARHLFNEKQFDLKYPVVADQDWMMYMYKHHKKIRYIDLPVSYYEENGFSSDNPERVKAASADLESIHQKYFGIRRTIYRKLRYLILRRS